jgi:hypothetical protein
MLLMPLMRTTPPFWMPEMQRLLIAACAVLSACSVGSDWKPSRSGEIIRYTTVGSSLPFDSIILGERWKTAGKYGARDGDTLVSLPPGTFGGADAIDVYRNTGGVVTRIEFLYRARRDVNALLHDYRSSLGPPFAATTDTLGGAIRHTTRWQDNATEFVLSTMTPPQKDSVGAVAVLSDRSHRR